MTNSSIRGVYTAVAASLGIAVAGPSLAEAPLVAQSNISQSQTGWGNSQSISIGNAGGDASPPQATHKSKKKLSSTQKDPDTGNTQSADVSGGGSGNVSQSQSGRNNAQSISIGGNTEEKRPTVTQTQTGANRQQSVTVDGKKVDTTKN